MTFGYHAFQWLGLSGGAFFDTNTMVENFYRINRVHLGQVKIRIIFDSLVKTANTFVTINRCDKLVIFTSLVTINGQKDESSKEEQEEDAPADIGNASILVENAINLGKSTESAVFFFLF